MKFTRVSSVPLGYFSIQGNIFLWKNLIFVNKRYYNLTILRCQKGYGDHFSYIPIMKTLILVLHLQFRHNAMKIIKLKRFFFWHLKTLNLEMTCPSFTQENSMSLEGGVYFEFDFLIFHLLKRFWLQKFSL